MLEVASLVSNSQDWKDNPQRTSPSVISRDHHNLERQSPDYSVPWKQTTEKKHHKASNWLDSLLCIFLQLCPGPDVEIQRSGTPAPEQNEPTNEEPASKEEGQGPCQ